MDSVSRPLIALLLGTVAVFAVWLVALKPSSSPGGGAASPSVYSAAIAKAHQAVATSAASSVAHGGTVVSAAPGAGVVSAVPKPARPPQTVPRAEAAPTAATARPARRVATPRASTSASERRAAVVTHALRTGRAIALLFYNPAAADDRAVRGELGTVPIHRGRVVKLSVPLSELARYAVVTNQVTVNSSPTLVVIDRGHHASTLVGFADRFEIAQRVSDALSAP